jgi:CubicO group peptidase (beta-lactamase class C family)
VVLNPAALARALVAWRTEADETVRSVVVSLRSGEQSWTGTADDGAPGARPDPDATVAAASITKTFTAALVLRLVDQGRIDLDAPLPSIAGLGLPPTGLTVRRLLTHSGGLVDYMDTPGYRADQPLAPAQAVRLSFDTPLRSEPGTAVSYANSGYLYLGLLLERLTDRSYGQLVADLAAEVGLSRTRVDPTTRTGWIGYASGGVVSTPAELARWGQALFTPGVVLSPRALSLLTTIGDLNLGLGAWPSCPCWTDAAGVKRSTAIGHTTANGGLFWFPATSTAMYVRFDPAPEDAVDLMAALIRAVR